MSTHDTSQHISKLPPGDINSQKGNEKNDGLRTKYGRRQRKTNDRLTKNARVRNSYLKITMDDSVFDELYHTVCKAKQLWDIQNISNDTGSPPQTISKKQSKRQLTIKPRTRNSLHMTYFFAGQVLDDMPSEELQRWESMVRNCVLAHINNKGMVPGEYSLQFKSLVTFPPRRNNLIVAKFEASAALDDLYEQLCNLALMEKENKSDDTDASAKTMGLEKEYEFPLLAELTKKQHKQRSQHTHPCWVAHVTLGNLVGGTKEDMKRLSKWLDERCYEEVDTMSASDVSPRVSSDLNDTAAFSTEHVSVLGTGINALGLALGGPVPEHVDIDWNFPFYNSGDFGGGGATSTHGIIS